MSKGEISQKRWIVFIVVALSLSIMIFAGSFQLVHSKTENAAGPVPSQITQSIISEMNYKDLVEVSSSQLSKHYDIPDGVIADSSLYMSKASDSASELACFQLTDKAKFDELHTIITSHLNSKSNGFKSLNPTQYNALKNATVVQQGKYVLVSVGSNSAADEKLFRDLVK